MSSDDSELERLKAKRLAEMQKNISFREQPNKTEPGTQEKKPGDPRETVLQRLGYRGPEVLQNAEVQFPNETKMILEKLSEMIVANELHEELDGGKLLLLFRSVGLNIRMKTKINVEKDGKIVSLSDKLQSESGDRR